MSSMSRRALLGYSGTAAASAAIGGTASAQPALAEDAADTTSTEFAEGTLFTGYARIPDADVHLGVQFSIDTSDVPSAYRIAPTEIADLLNDFFTQRGWSAVTFYGTPPPAPLN